VLKNERVGCCTVPHFSFVIPSGSEESSVWMLHFIQHDRVGHREHFFRVIPNAVRNPLWMLRFAQHDKKGKCAPFRMTAHPQDTGA